MIQRIAEKKLRELAGMFKSVAVIGPRQSGKTTLVKKVFNNKPYVNLENPDTRMFAMEDPRGFLKQYPQGAILDEVQRTPDIFSYLQEILDSDKVPGKFILTGSNNFLLQENISQSLAGRIAYLYLLPFGIDELYFKNKHPDEYEIILKGLFPPVYDQQIPPTEWYPNYIRTYIERDVRQIKNITDLLVFERFIRILAGRTGYELNYSSISIEVGVDIKTIQSWIGILEKSFIVFTLRPHFKNFNKTIVKRPKIYFYDTGLICNLLEIKTINQLQQHPHKGFIFENFIVSELIKKRSNRGIDNNLYYWRDKTGHEIDIIIDNAGQLTPLEIKSGKTIHDEFFRNLKYWHNITGNQGGFIIYAGDISQNRTDKLSILSWKELIEVFV